MNITKLELCSKVSKQIEENPKLRNVRGLSLISLQTILESFLEELVQSVLSGNRVEIRGFGTFKAVTRKKKLARNPRTNEAVEVPAHTAPKFKFSKEVLKKFK